MVSEGPILERVVKDGATLVISFNNTDGGLMLRPTAQCNTHAAGLRPAENITSPSDCCSATPRFASAKGSHIKDADGGVPFEVQLARCAFEDRMFHSRMPLDQ
jgi:hypothetical protein